MYEECWNGKSETFFKDPIKILEMINLLMREIKDKISIIIRALKDSFCHDMCYVIKHLGKKFFMYNSQQKSSDKSSINIKFKNI